MKLVQRSDNNNSTAWSAGSRFWRIGWSVYVHQHRGVLPDRWVLQTSFNYDRKAFQRRRRGK